MNDADRHDQIETLTELKRVLDDEGADADDIRDAAIRAVNRFDASIAAHDGWQPYSRRGSSDPGTRAEAHQLGETGVERHPEYRGRLRRRIGNLIAQIAIKEAPAEAGNATTDESRDDEPVLRRAKRGTSTWRIQLYHHRPWTLVVTTTGSLADAEMAGARRLAAL